MRTGNILIVAGIALVVIGFAVRLGMFSWFGHLPGDIHVEGENGRFFFPITSCLVVSVGLTLLINLAARLWRGGS
jgi:hypothetical protein